MAYIDIDRFDDIRRNAIKTLRMIGKHPAFEERAQELVEAYEAAFDDLLEHASPEAIQAFAALNSAVQALRREALVSS